jgi:integrase
MARSVIDSNLKDRTARSRLAARGKPHYRLIEPGLHLGYRKPRGRKGKAAAAGAWVVRHYVGGQAYVTETIGTADDYSDSDGVAVLDFRQAQDKARAAHVRRAHADAGVAGPLTVAAALAAHFEHLEGKGQSVVDQQYHARAFILPTLGDVEVSALTAERIRRWFHGLIKLPPRVRTRPGQPQQYRAIDEGDADALRRRKSSANRIRTTLAAALNHAYDEGKVASNAAWSRAGPFENVDRARLRYLTVAEAKRLINAADPEFRPMVMAALQSGCRYGELCRLKIRDFNPDSATLAIWQSKSGKPRHVVLADEGAQFFAQLCAGRDPGDLMLPRADGRAWGKGHQNAFMVDACRRAKIPPIGFHGLRHSWASLAVMAGMPLMVVAQNLGHASTKMVEKHYGHLSKSYITDAVRDFAPKFGIAKSNVSVLR